MNTPVGIWQITKGKPKRLPVSKVDLETKLEEWIEQDPELIRAGLTIVGRQVRTAGGPIDLLAVDEQGRWIVIEIKRGAARRDTIAQALDYASCIKGLSIEELIACVDPHLTKRKIPTSKFKAAFPDAFETEGKREVEMIVVATGRDSGFQRIATFVEQIKIPMTVVLFDVFSLASGEQVLLRELEKTNEPENTRVGQDSKEKTLCDAATRLGIGDEFREILGVGKEFGLKKRITNRSIMYAPPSDGRRVLFLVYGAETAKNGGLLVWVSTQGFKDFFGIGPVTLKKALGENGWAGLDSKERTRKFVNGLRELLSRALRTAD